MATEIVSNKQSVREIRTHYVDFSNDLPSGVTVSSAAATHVPPSGDASVVTVGTIASNVVPVTLPVQTITGWHQIKVLATLSNGDKSDAILLVEVVPASYTAAMLTYIQQMRKMINEPTANDFSDSYIEDVITQYVMVDELGTAPYYYTETGSTPTQTTNTEWIPTYDLNAAAADLWTEKAGKLADRFDFTADGASFHRSQAYEQAMKQARFYSSRRKPKTMTMHVWTDNEADDDLSN